MILADEGCRGCGADLAVAGSWAEMRQGGVAWMWLMLAVHAA